MPVTIKDWVSDATQQLIAAEITSARLDAEIILAHTIHKPRTYLHAHDDATIDAHYREIADARLDLRLDRTPVAYIVGHKEFYGRQFKVTTATLIPRPESETIIEILKEVLPSTLSLIPDKKSLIDVGTGSGCLGISAKLEFPDLDVTLLDISRHALNIAEWNAKKLLAQVKTERGDLLRGQSQHRDIIIANLPYVDASWEVSPETRAEPELALYASRGGLALINQLIPQAEDLLNPGGILLLEADPRQHDAIIRECKTHEFNYVQTRGFIVHATRR